MIFRIGVDYLSELEHISTVSFSPHLNNKHWRMALTAMDNIVARMARDIPQGADLGNEIQVEEELLACGYSPSLVDRCLEQAIDYARGKRANGELIDFGLQLIAVIAIVAAAASTIDAARAATTAPYEHWPAALVMPIGIGAVLLLTGFGVAWSAIHDWHLYRRRQKLLKEFEQIAGFEVRSAIGGLYR